MQFPKWAVISGIIVGVIGGSAAGVFLWQKALLKKAVEPSVDTVSAPVVASSTWNDPAGFTFQYPGDLTVDKHDEDTENYAHVELTSNSHPGNLIVWVQDTNAADANAWVKTEKLFTGATIAEATLGGKPAKTVSGDELKKVITGTISDGLLFMIETVPTDAAYWTEVHDAIAKSFMFAPLGQDSASQDAPAAEEWSDEEVLQ